MECTGKTPVIVSAELVDGSIDVPFVLEVIRGGQEACTWAASGSSRSVLRERHCSGEKASAAWVLGVAR